MFDKIVQDKKGLLIISYTRHYKNGSEIVGFEPTVREIDSLAKDFYSVKHIAFLIKGSPPASSALYAAKNVSLILLPPSGGNTIKEKLRILLLLPLYVFYILKELKKIEVVHIRAPGNICFIAILLLPFLTFPPKRWIKYAGNWSPTIKEPITYAFQRWWLKKGFCRAKVTVVGSLPGDPSFIHSVINPCLDPDEIMKARGLSSSKDLSLPLKLLFVGNFGSNKGVDRVLKIFQGIQKLGIKSSLDIVGDGENRDKYERLSGELRISEFVKFHGWLPRYKIGPLYEKAHFLFMLSYNEGFPKVVGEAMAYGVVPLASNISCMQRYLNIFKTGQVFDPDNLNAFINSVQWYLLHPHEWAKQSENAKNAADAFTYEEYVNRIKDILAL